MSVKGHGGKRAPFGSRASQDALNQQCNWPVKNIQNIGKVNTSLPAKGSSGFSASKRTMLGLSKENRPMYVGPRITVDPSASVSKPTNTLATSVLPANNVALFGWSSIDTSGPANSQGISSSSWISSTRTSKENSTHNTSTTVINNNTLNNINNVSLYNGNNNGKNTVIRRFAGMFSSSDGCSSASEFEQFDKNDIKAATAVVTSKILINAPPRFHGIYTSGTCSSDTTIESDSGSEFPTYKVSHIHLADVSASNPDPQFQAHVPVWPKPHRPRFHIGKDYPTPTKQIPEPKTEQKSEEKTGIQPPTSIRNPNVPLPKVAQTVSIQHFSQCGKGDVGSSKKLSYAPSPVHFKIQQTRPAPAPKTTAATGTAAQSAKVDGGHSSRPSSGGLSRPSSGGLILQYLKTRDSDRDTPFLSCPDSPTSLNSTCSSLGSWASANETSSISKLTMLSRAVDERRNRQKITLHSKTAKQSIKFVGKNDTNIKSTSRRRPPRISITQPRQNRDTTKLSLSELSRHSRNLVEQDLVRETSMSGMAARTTHEPESTNSNFSIFSTLLSMQSPKQPQLASQAPHLSTSQTTTQSIAGAGSNMPSTSIPPPTSPPPTQIAATRVVLPPPAVRPPVSLTIPSGSAEAAAAAQLSSTTKQPTEAAKSNPTHAFKWQFENESIRAKTEKLTSRFLSVEQTANLLRIRQSEVVSLIERGDLPAVEGKSQIGSSSDLRRVNLDALHSFVDSRNPQTQTQTSTTSMQVPFDKKPTDIYDVHIELSQSSCPSSPTESRTTLPIVSTPHTTNTNNDTYSSFPIFTSPDNKLAGSGGSGGNARNAKLLFRGDPNFQSRSNSPVDLFPKSPFLSPPVLLLPTRSLPTQSQAESHPSPPAAKVKRNNFASQFLTPEQPNTNSSTKASTKSSTKSKLKAKLFSGAKPKKLETETPKKQRLVSRLFKKILAKSPFSKKKKKQKSVALEDQVSSLDNNNFIGFGPIAEHLSKEKNDKNSTPSSKKQKFPNYPQPPFSIGSPLTPQFDRQQGLPAGSGHSSSNLVASLRAVRNTRCNTRSATSEGTSEGSVPGLIEADITHMTRASALDTGGADTDQLEIDEPWNEPWKDLANHYMGLSKNNCESLSSAFAKTTKPITFRSTVKAWQE